MPGCGPAPPPRGWPPGSSSRPSSWDRARSDDVQRPQVVLAEAGGLIPLDVLGQRLDIVVVRHRQDRHFISIDLLDPLVVRQRLLAGGGEDRGVKLLVELLVLELAEVGRAR